MFLLASHPPLGLVDVFAATLPTLEFSPGGRGAPGEVEAD